MEIESDNDGDVPDDRRGVGEKELAVRVQDSKTPGGENEEADTGEEDANELDREVARGSFETRRDQRNEDRSEGDSKCDENGSGEGEKSEDGFGKLRGFFIAFLGAEPGVNGDEGCGEYTFTEEILEKVWDTERGAKCVGDFRVSEKVSEDALADESGDLAEEHSGSDGDGRGTTSGRLRSLGIGQSAASAERVA
jgi:hypothetical protein